jgi:hypothetical protein
MQGDIVLGADIIDFEKMEQGADAAAAAPAVIY